MVRKNNSQEINEISEIMLPQTSLYLSQDMIAPEVTQGLGGSVVVFSNRCPEKITGNEDAAAAILCQEKSGVLIVADGMGGGASGELASRIAVEAMQEEVRRHPPDQTVLRSAILNGIEGANQQILDLGIGAATTLAAVEIQDGTIRPYHIGDSAILVVGQRGKIKLLTIAHSPVGQAVEAGVLDNEEAMHHEDRHLVSNVLGTADMRIEIGPPIRLSPFDTLMLASDGLFDNLSIDEIVQYVRRGPLLEGIASIAQAVSARMKEKRGDAPSKPDDLTVIAFRLDR